MPVECRLHPEPDRRSSDDGTVQRRRLPHRAPARPPATATGSRCTHPRGTHTYAELTAEVRRVAAGLVALGVRPEERVLLCMTDDVELATGILAAMYLGAVAVPCVDDAHRRRAGQAGRRLARPGAAGQRRVRRTSAAAAAADAPDLRHVVLTGDAAPEVPGVTGLTWDALRDAEPLAAPYADLGRVARAVALHLRHHRHAQGRDAPPHRHPVRLPRPTAPRCSACAPTTSACRRPSCSSPTASATRCSSRWRWARARCWSRRRPNPALFAERIAEHGVTLFFGGPSFWGPLMAADLPRGDVRDGPQRRLGRARRCPPRMFHGVQGAVRLRDPRRHRLHRGAAHLHLQRGRQGRAGQLRVPGAGLPGGAAPRRRHRSSRAPGEPGMLYVAGDSICTGYWCRTAVEPGGVPGRVDAHRRPVRARRGRQLHLPGPRRRRAQGRRHLGEPDRGGDPAAGAPGAGRGRGRRRARRGRAGQAGGLRRPARRARGSTPTR